VSAPLAGDVVEEVVVLRGRDLRVVRPRDPEALLDEEAFEREERLPYWAEPWPSGLALAQAVAGRSLRGARVVELGCGLGLVSLAAALAGGRALATDWSQDAVAFAAANAERNGLAVQTAVCAWGEPDALVARAPWDLVLAADVLYERRNVGLLLALLPRLGSEVWLADPGRPPAREFLDAAAREWLVHSRRLPGGPAVSLHRLRRRQ
jgi:predicted nicotinamide N-methyase